MSRGVLPALLWLAVAAGPLSARAAGLATEWLTPGTDPRNRINLLVLGDGYTADAASQARLRSDADQLVAGLFRTSPFGELRALFTVKLVHVISNQAGATNGAAGEVRDTALGAYYRCGGVDRLICLDYAKALQLAAEYFPEYTLVVVLVNDPKSGGSGGAVAVTSVDEAAWQTFIHEMGHSLGGLADEYAAAYPGFPDCDPVTDCPEPNVTVRTRRGEIKWLPWIAPSTPIPTPSLPSFQDCGLFEGARYRFSGVFRPVFDGCMMRVLSWTYCSVCREALVTAILGRLALVESAVGPDAVASCAPSAFSLDLRPATGFTRAIQWTVDGQARPEAGPALSLALGEGTHAVSVAVRDSTTLVRSDPRGALAGTASFTVRVGPCAGALLSPVGATVPPRGTVAFGATGGAGGYAFSLVASRSGGSIAASGQYTAGPRGGVTDVVRVTDAGGAGMIDNVTVGPGVQISPLQASLASGATQAFGATGGSGTGYRWSLSANGSGATIDATTGLYRAGPQGPATDRLQVADDLGNVAEATVTVAAPQSSKGGCSSGAATGVASLLLLLCPDLLRRRRGARRRG